MNIHLNAYPTPRDLINKVHVLQQLKAKFSSKSDSKSSLAKKEITATQAELGKKTMGEILAAKQGYFRHSDEKTIQRITKLAEELLEKENLFPNESDPLTNAKVKLRCDPNGETIEEAGCYIRFLDLSKLYIIPPSGENWESL